MRAENLFRIVMAAATVAAILLLGPVGEIAEDQVLLVMHLALH